MRRVLHILSRPDDEFVRDLTARQQSDPGHEVIVVDLTQPSPNYAKLLEEIFAADSVQNW